MKLAVYEVNLGALDGNVTQDQLDSTIPSLGAGLAVADHMLLMLRDLGVTTQAFFCLPEFNNGFTNTANPDAHESMKLWGSVIDMGGPTNRVRPAFLAEALVNSAMRGTMLEAVQSGDNPTWDQPESINGKIKLKGAHLLQSFAFAEGAERSLILFNLSRTASLPVTFSGPNAPRGKIAESRLTSAAISDSNELEEKVVTRHESLLTFQPTAPYALPPFSITVLTWKAN